MAERILLRRDTAANWTTANPVLAFGEVGLDETANRWKIGDGTTAWSSLAYATDAVGAAASAQSAAESYADNKFVPTTGLDSTMAGQIIPGGSQTASAIAADPALKAAFGTAVNLSQAQRYRTTWDRSNLLTHATPPAFAAITDPTGAIFVNPDDRGQGFYGVGAALTDAAAYCLMTYLTAAERTALLTELFSPDQCGWSMVRICMGSSDFSSVAAYTYDDMPAGQTDTNLTNFSVAADAARIIPILQQIVAINPRVRIIAAPWTAPAWMKDSGALYGGGFLTANYDAYAQYFVKFVQAYASYGIPIWAVSPQNEPLTSNTNYPTMTMASDVEAAFVGSHLGPAFDSAGLRVKILCYDQHWDQSSYSLAVLNDAAAGPYTAGVAWHAYAGDPTKQTTVHRSKPLVEHHMTEMRDFASDSYTTALQIMAGDLAVGSVRNWGNSITLWNLALDENGGPHLYNAGRRGVLTVPSDGSDAVRNPEYYVLTHLAKYLKPGAVRIGSTSPAVGKSATGMQTVAFANPDQSITLFVYNSDTVSHSAQIVDTRQAKSFTVTVQPNELSTFRWGTSELATLNPAPGSAAPELDGYSISPTNSTGSITWTHTVGAGPNRLLLVQVGNTAGADISTTAVTFGGTPLTFVAKAINTIGSGQRHISLWALVNPPSGAGTVAVTCGSGSNSGAIATSYAQVNQATPYGTPAAWTTSTSVTSVSETVTGTTANDLVHAVGFVRSTTDPVPSAAQAVMETDAVSSNARMVVTNQPGEADGSTTASFSWPTADAGSMIALALRGA